MQIRVLVLLFKINYYIACILMTHFSFRAYQQGEINLATHEQPVYLLELLELVFEQFRCVVHSHNVIIRNLKRIKSATKYSNYKNLALYDITEVG